MAERQRTECGERTLPIFGDARQFLHRAVIQKILFPTRRHFDEADTLGGVGRELGELGGICQSRRDRQPDFLFDALPDALDIIRRRRVAPDMGKTVANPAYLPP